jgi:hypothetical protein
MHSLAAALLDLWPRFRLPIYADVFGIFFGSGGDARLYPRKLVGIEATGPLPTLGRSWG